MMIRALFLMSLTALIGCGSTPRILKIQGSASAPLLEAVPADATYLLGSLTPYPEPLRTRQKQTLAKFLSEIDGLASVAERQPSTHSLFALTLSAKLAPHLQGDTLQDIGLSPTLEFVVYSAEWMPTLRMQVSDATRLRRFFDETARAAGLTPAWTPRGDWQVWRSEDGNLGFLMALRAEQLVVRLYFLEDSATVLPQALGETPPKRPFDAAKADAFLARHGYQGWNFGWIDLAPVLAPGSALNRAAHQEHPRCPDELKALVDWIPRLEFGSKSSSPKGYTGSIHLPLTPDARRDWAAMTRPARGPRELKRVDGAFMSLGFDTPTLIDAMTNWGARRVKQPYQCPIINGLNEAAQAAAGLPVPYQLQKIQGFAAAMPGGMVEALPEMALAIYAQSAQPIVGLLATQLPFLAELTTGTLHPIPMPMPAPVHWLQVDNAVSGSFGTAGAKRLRSLAESTIETDAFLIMHIDERFLNAMQREQDALEPPADRQSAVQQRLDAATQTNDLFYIFGRMGPTGVDFEMSVRYQDAAL